MVRTLTKRLTLLACLLMAAVVGVLSWWAWKGFDDTLKAECFRTRHYENLAALQVVHNLGAELFHLDFTFRVEVGQGIREGVTDWPRRLEVILAAYQARAHYPGLLKDLVVASQVGSRSTWLGWTPQGWVARPRPDWVSSQDPFEPSSDPMIDLEDPVWMIGLPARSGVKQVVVIRYDLDTVIKTIVPDLAKNALGYPQTHQEFMVEVNHGAPPGEIPADLRIPLVPRVPFSSWLQTYLERSPVPLDDAVVPPLPLGSQPQWTLEVRLLPHGLAAFTGAIRLRNLWTAAGLMAALTAGFIGILWLVSRLVQAARREKVFSSLVSHELKTPVAAIRSLSENLSSGLVADPAKVREYGALIEDQTQRLGEMIGNMLALASMDAPGVSLVREVFDAAALVEEAAALWGLPASIGDGPWLVRGNRAAIRAALDNLVTNALRYGVKDGGSPDVALELSRERRGAVVWIGMGVVDHGPGLSRSELRRLFRPYRRGTQADRRQVPGGGIGLSLVKATLGHLGGRVRVAPVPGGGLRCTLWLREGG